MFWTVSSVLTKGTILQIASWSCFPLLHGVKQGMIAIHSCLLHLFFSCTKHIALTLWDQLGDGTPQHHQKSVELFYQLHNLVPSSSICEDVISQQLTHRDKASCSCIYLKMSKVYAEVYLEKGLGPSEEGMNNLNVEKNVALHCFKYYFRFVMSL